MRRVCHAIALPAVGHHEVQCPDRIVPEFDAAAKERVPDKCVDVAIFSPSLMSRKMGGKSTTAIRTTVAR